MKKYPKYKDSGVRWIGEIPDNWGVKRLKYITKSIKEKSIDGNEELLSVSEYYGIVPRTFVRDENETLTRSESLEGYLKVNKGDLVNNIMLMWKRGLGVSNYEGIVSPAYSVFRFEEGIPHYFNYLLRTDLYTSEYRKNSTGVIESRLRLYDDEFGNIYSILPPSVDQQQIIEFLDQKTSIIDDLIQKKQRKIELLREQRTSIINQTITKGLNPNVKMKYSGVEWIGYIPEQWEMKRIKYLGESIIGLSYNPDNVVDEGDGILVLRSSNIQNGKPSYEDNVYVNVEIPNKLKVKVGDILICSRSGSRDLIGKNMLIPKELEGVTFGVFMTVLRSKYYNFLYWFLNSQIFTNQSGLFLTSTINQLTLSTLNNFLVPFPNNEIEREQMCTFLYDKMNYIDDIIQTENKKINILKEYRQSLILEVVTGQIDVRKN